MSKKIYQSPKVLEVNRNQNPNSSSVAINSSYLHQGYYSQNTSLTGVSCCQYCKKIGNTGLIPVCECDDKLFHQSCFRQWLSEMVKQKRVSVKQQNGYKVMQCSICHFKIKIKASITSQCSNCQQMSKYCSQHQAFTAGIVFLMVLIIAGAACLVLILLGFIKFSDQGIQRSAILIAAGIIIALMIIICLCCSIECLRTQKIQVQTMYDKTGRLHRSSGRSRRGSRRISRKKIAVENIE